MSISAAPGYVHTVFPTVGSHGSSTRETFMKLTNLACHPEFCLSSSQECWLEGGRSPTASWILTNIDICGTRLCPYGVSYRRVLWIIHAWDRYKAQESSLSSRILSVIIPRILAGRGALPDRFSNLTNVDIRSTRLCPYVGSYVPPVSPTVGS